MDLVAWAAVAVFGLFVWAVYWLAKHPKTEDGKDKENDHTPELVAMTGVITNNPILSSVAYGIPQPVYTDPPLSGDDLFDEAVAVVTAANLLSEVGPDDTLGPCPAGEAAPTGMTEAVSSVWEHHEGKTVDIVDTTPEKDIPIDTDTFGEAEPAEIKTETVPLTEAEEDRAADKAADKAEDAADAASDAAEDTDTGSSDTGGGDD
jgi:hypothetical protein